MCTQLSTLMAVKYSLLRSAPFFAPAAMQTFQEDWLAEATRSDATATDAPPSFSKQRAQQRDMSFGPAVEQPQEGPDVVRPGRLLTTLHAMRQELETQLVSAGPNSPVGIETLGLLRRLDDIRVESLVALDRVQHSRGSADDSPTSSPLDYEHELEEHDMAVQEFR